MSLTVLHLVNSLYQGGTERQALQLARLQQEAGTFRVHVATLSPDGSLRPEVDALRVDEVPEYPLRRFYDFQMAQQLARCVGFVRRKRIDVFHAHGFHPNIFGMIAGTLAGVPVRIASKRETGDIRTVWQSRAERLAFRTANVVLANCDAIRDRLIAEGVSRERVVTVHNGIDPRRVTSRSTSREEALAVLGLDAEPACRYVSLVANLHLPIKDHETFLRAAQQIAAEVPDARFLIAGEGALLPGMRSLAAQLGVASVVFFLGRCDRLAELLLLSEVCALSSTTEGFPNVVLEYMAAGRPVVATDVGGTAEAVRHEHTGFIVPPHNHGLMAARILDLLRAPERARAMGELGRKVALETFSCERQLARTTAVYTSLLARARGRKPPS